jgi:hypothetical protein
VETPPCKDPIRALAERTALVDGLVERAAGDKLWPAFPSGLTLLAVGGYGRRHLFPYSDVDLLLLVESGRLAQNAPESISAFLQSLWDSGLRLSHSVRTPEECAEIHDQNIELNVSLLDQRYLAGDRALYAGFADRLPRFLHAQRDALMRNLTRLSRERHQKYQNTYYHLEPNIKDTPGGLRDYQLVRWLSQLRSVEAPQIAPAFLFMARLRCLLHSLSGRLPVRPSGCAIILGMRATSIARRCAKWNRARRSRARCSRNSRTGAHASRTPISAWPANACTCACRAPWRSIRNWHCGCFNSWPGMASGPLPKLASGSPPPYRN